MQILPKYAFAITATLAFVTVSTSRAQVSGVNAAFSPVGQRIFFSEDSGLTDGFLYGGDFGFRFGQFLELGGNYFFGNRLETDFSHFTPGLLTDNVMDKTAALEALGELETREVRLRRYGGKLRINVGHGRVFPFLSTGTGILRFNPDGVSASDYIYAQAGVGLTLGVSERYSASVSVENLSYRYNPATTFLNDDELVTAELSREDFRRATVHNWGLSASLHMNLGARASDWLTYFDRALLSQYRGGYFRLVVEPFYGQINFNDGLAFPASRAIGGINAGVDLGPYIGLRGFYWRDTDQEGIFEEGLPNKLGDVEFYGGELNLRFNSQFGARNFTPYLIVGGGYMNVTAGSGFVDLHGIVPESRYFAMGGGGMELSLTSVIKLQGSLRSVLMSPGAIEDVSTPGNVLGSLMYTAGFNFNIGSRGRTLGSSIQRQLAAERAKNQVLAKAMEVELARIQARLDSLEATPAGWQTSEADSAETRTAESHAVNAGRFYLQTDTDPKPSLRANVDDPGPHGRGTTHQLWECACRNPWRGSPCSASDCCHAPCEATASCRPTHCALQTGKPAGGGRFGGRSSRRSHRNTNSADRKRGPCRAAAPARIDRRRARRMAPTHGKSHPAGDRPGI